MSDSFSALNKLHSYTPPNPTIISPPSPPPEITPNSYCLYAHCTNLFSFNIHHLGDEEGGIRSSSSRWIPTPAQLLHLEQLYTQGTKTPTAQQIQLIASQLRRFGNIQAKNVFYWFQNHKARERQKRRRCHNKIQEISPPSPLAAAHDQEKDHQICVLGLSSQHQSSQHPPSQGLRGTGYEVKETKKWPSASNCSALAEVSDSLMNRAERSGAYRRTQREERETQTSRIKREESQEARFQIRDMSTCFLPNSSRYHHIKSITTTTSTSITHHTQTSNPKNYYSYEEEEQEGIDDRTLKLFPLKRSDEDEEGLCGVNERGKHKFCCFNNNASIMDSDEITSNQFFEFLPLRN